MTRRPVRLAVVAALAALLAVGGTALAAFTDTETNPQDVTAGAFPDTSSDMTIQSANDNPTDVNQITLRLQVTNAGTADLDLQTVTLRYWLTNDYGTAGVDSRCNYVPPPLDCGKVTRSTGLVEPARVGADRYLQLGFSAGTLAPGAATGAIQVQVFRASGGDPFDQSDDYSHTTRTSLADAPNVTGYVNGELAWGEEPGSRPAAPGLRVRYTDLDGNPFNQTMAPGLIVNNTGATTLQLNQVKLKYWFSRKDKKNDRFDTFCDYAAIGCGSVTHQVVNGKNNTPNADSVLEVGFTGATLPPGSSTGEVRLRANDSKFRDLDETDDYSHGSTGPYVVWQKVTGYIGGALAWGTEP